MGLLYKGLKIIALVLGVLGAVALANLLFTGDEVVKQTGEGLNLFLNLAYVTFFLTILLVLIFVFRDLFTSGSSVKSTLLGVGLLLVVLAVSYGIANGDAITLANGAHLSESGSRWVSTGLNAFYFLGIGAIAVMLISEIKNLTISK